MNRILSSSEGIDAVADKHIKIESNLATLHINILNPGRDSRPPHDCIRCQMRQHTNARLHLVRDATADKC
jgi:hypothetical protein